MENNTKEIQKLENQPVNYDFKFEYKDYEGWKKALAKSPNPKLLKKNRGIWYLPIQLIKTRLNYFLGGYYKVEVLDSKQFANSIAVTVRLHYLHPFLKEWFFFDGCGAAALQVDAGSSPMDSEKIKSNAVHIGFPAAKSFALKNAAKELGAAFGANLNKDYEDIFMVNPLVEDQHKSLEEKNREIEDKRIYDLIATCKTLDELEKLKLELDKEEKLTKEFNQAINTERKLILTQKEIKH